MWHSSTLLDPADADELLHVFGSALPGKHVVDQVIDMVPHPDVGIEECIHVLSIVFACANDVVREEQNFNEILC